MKILPPTVSLEELIYEWSRFQERLSSSEYFDEKNWTLVKKATKYNFFTPYESKTVLAKHILATVAAAPSLAIVAAAMVCVAIVQAIQRACKAPNDEWAGAKAFVEGGTPALQAHLARRSSQDEIGNPTASLALALVYAILAPLAPVLLLLGVLSRSIITALSHLTEGSEPAAGDASFAP